MTTTLILAFLHLAAFAAHDFKMSVCEVEYIQQGACFEMRFYLFQDDFKEALTGDPMAPSLEETGAAAYILEKTSMEADGKAVLFDFVEMKERADQVQVIFRSKGKISPPTSSLHLFNRLLLEKFRQQTNMVYVVMPGRSKITQIMNGAKTKVEILF